VEKCTNSACTTGTLYWTGTGADALLETDLTGAGVEEYIFFNGKRVARRDNTGGNVHYYFSDHLGSHAVIQSGDGSTCEHDIDYYPYGGQQQDYCSGPAQNYMFNAKERDSESGLDMFGARYYGSSLGRFMTPDWAPKPLAVPYANYGNPQSLNLYSYVENNPTTFGDPDGHLAPDGLFYGDPFGSGEGTDLGGMAFANTANVGGGFTSPVQEQAPVAAYDPNQPLYTPHGVVYGNPRDPTNPGSPLIQNPIVQQASNDAFMKTMNGRARGGLAEAGFAIEYIDGKISIAHQVDSVNESGKPNALSITKDDNTIAILHTHGNSAQAIPSEGDRSPDAHVPDFVKSLRSIYVTIPNSAAGKTPVLNDYVQLQ
jgi:RHS repeat-associated protein